MSAARKKSGAWATHDVMAKAWRADLRALVRSQIVGLNARSRREPCAPPRARRGFDDCACSNKNCAVAETSR